MSDITLSETLKSIHDTFAAWEAECGQITIAGEELKSLVETLDLARAAAERLEDDLARTTHHGAAQPAETTGVIPFPRRHHRRPQGSAAWRPVPPGQSDRSRPDEGDDGGDVA